METYRFTVKIPEDRKFQIPDFPGLSEKKVEIVIRSKPSNTIKKGDAKAFIEKWAGFIKESNTDKTKYDYLSKKYK